MASPQDPKAARETLHARLKRRAIPHSRVEELFYDSLPALFFGDIYRARVATVGINPSKHQFRKPSLKKPSSFGVSQRESLSEDQCVQAIDVMLHYFAGDVSGWFTPLKNVLYGFQATYEEDEVVHLNLVQEAAYGSWSDWQGTHRRDAEALLELDSSFLSWELETFGIQTILCTSEAVSRKVLELFRKDLPREQDLNGVKWWVDSVAIGDRLIYLAGWDGTLRFVSAGTQHELGEMLAYALYSSQSAHDIMTTPDRDLEVHNA